MNVVNIAERLRIKSETELLDMCRSAMRLENVPNPDAIWIERDRAYPGSSNWNARVEHSARSSAFAIARAKRAIDRLRESFQIAG